MRESERFEVEVSGSGSGRKKGMVPLKMKMRGFNKRRHLKLENMKQGFIS